MKLLLFSDLHCDVQAAERLVGLAGGADVVIGAGDFATLRRQLQLTIEVLRQIEQPTVVVPGNSESYDELVAACADWPAAHVLHGQGVEIDGVAFYGLGGGRPRDPIRCVELRLHGSGGSPAAVRLPRGGGPGHAFPASGRGRSELSR